MVSLVIIAMHNGVLKLKWKFFTDLKQIIFSCMKQLKNSITLYIKVTHFVIHANESYANET